MASRYNAEHIGSLLRPDYLLEARRAAVPDDEMRAVEDRAIVEVLRYQEDLGLELVTDGEYRRTLWMKVLAQLYDGLDPEGFERSHRDESGNVERFGVPTPVAKLSRKASWIDIEFDFVKRHTAKAVKITMPSPSLLMSYWKPGISDRAYPDQDAYMADLVRLMNEDARALAQAGCAYIQIDAPQYTYITDSRIRPDITDPAGTLTKMITYDNGVFEGVQGAVTGLHLCRGNYKSMWTGDRPYEEFAEIVFSQSRCDRLLLEYDDYRSGDFAALRFVPSGVDVVLGLLTTKRSEVEQKSDVLARVDDAARHLPLDRLALSPQCGFATIDEGNKISREAERAKLAMVVEMAREVWGAA
ncbi:MAG: methionine synthase [Chloroflexi bacterium]|nr:methionine synthase [Chloroflexota bacterium]